jgi:rhamnose utilization protein RhaD (predicted bifunctional aldolase and dehydrogenase)
MTKARSDGRKAEKLSEAEQEQLAAAIRAELEAETVWVQRLATSKNALEVLADEALAEHRAGRSLPLDPDKLLQIL